MRAGRYCYLVVGLDDDNHLFLNEEHGLHTSKEKAEAELGLVLNEIERDASEMGYEFNFVRTDDHLTIIYGNGIQERYTIKKMKLN